MERRAFTAGLLAGLVGVVWTALAMGLVPWRDSMGWKEAPNEDVMLPMLDESLFPPGTTRSRPKPSC